MPPRRPLTPPEGGPMRSHLVLLSPLLLTSLLAAAACGEDTNFPTLVEPTYATVPEVTAELVGLSFGDFLERSFAALAARSPETLTDLGLSAGQGQRDNFLDDVSDAFVSETYDLADALLLALRAYDRSSLSAADRLSYDVYEWYLDDVARERPFMHYVYSVNASVTSEHQRLIALLTQVHPLESVANAEDYVERLWRIRQRITDVEAGLDARAREGLLPPKAVLAPAQRDLAAQGAQAPTATDLYLRLAAGLDTIPALSSHEREQLLDEATRAIREAVLPAWRDLAAALGRLYPQAPDGEGLWALPGGTDYYAYVLRHHTTSDLGADAIHELGLAEVARLQGLIRERFAALGYPETTTFIGGFARVASDGGHVAARDCIRRYTEILADVTGRLGDAIDVQPKAPLEVRADRIGGYYIPGPPDGSAPGVFYAYVPPTGLPLYSMKTLAYHEGVPGHHLQVGLARERTDVPTLRRALVFTAHAEGWALYAEQLAAELGLYAGDVYGDLGRLQYELFRAARLVVDTGLHARRWTSSAAASYLTENLGFPAEVLWVPGQVARYLSWPGQATAYKVGMQKFLALRTATQARLGPDYNALAFHRLLLESGSLPLSVLERLVGETSLRSPRASRSPPAL